MFANRVYCTQNDHGKNQQKNQTLKVHGRHRLPLGVHKTALHQIHVWTVRPVPHHVVHLLSLPPLLVRVALESQVDRRHYVSVPRSAATAIGRVDQVAAVLEHHRQQVVVDLHARDHHVLDLSEVELARENEVVLRVTASFPLPRCPGCATARSGRNTSSCTPCRSSGRDCPSSRSCACRRRGPRSPPSSHPPVSPTMRGSDRSSMRRFTCCSSEKMEGERMMSLFRYP